MNNNLLHIKNPELFKEIHPTKNGNLDTFKLTVGSNKKIWWECNHRHHWDAIVNSRHVNNSGCPYCTNRKVCNDNCLATTHPELAKEWHPTKNGELTPYDVIRGSGIKVWWKCDVNNDHEFKLAIGKKTVKSCKCCSGRKSVNSNRLYSTHPEIFKQIHPTKNGDLNVFNLSHGLLKKIWWICDKGHEFEAAITCVVKGRTCECKKYITNENRLSIINPMLSTEWHPTKNGELTPYDVSFGSGENAWWQCNRGHSWPARISSRHTGNRCPYCANQKICLDNCLATVSPELAKEWHPTKNSGLTPYDISSHSNKKVWWKCEQGHVWKTTVNHRNNGTKCRKCINHGTSEIEKTFYYYFQIIFPNTISGYNINLEGRKVEIDIYIQDINVAIEYDSKLYHKKQTSIKRDIFKNNFIKEKQIKLLRIREFGLPKIHDVEFVYRYKKSDKKSFKDTMISILNYILSNFKLTSVQIQKIEEVKNIDFETYKIPKGFFDYQIKKNSLFIKNPQLSAEWHPTLNGDLKPEHVSCGSDKKVWWICKDGHVWDAAIHSRNSGYGCTKCYLLYKQPGQRNKPVRQIDKQTGHCIAIFKSAKFAMQETGVERRDIGRSCKNIDILGDYRWEFVNVDDFVTSLV